jgi:hypothetical protein
MGGVHNYKGTGTFGLITSDGSNEITRNHGSHYSRECFEASHLSFQYVQGHCEDKQKRDITLAKQMNILAEGPLVEA